MTSKITPLTGSGIERSLAWRSTARLHGQSMNQSKDTEIWAKEIGVGGSEWEERMSAELSRDRDQDLPKRGPKKNLRATSAIASCELSAAGSKLSFKARQCGANYNPCASREPGRAAASRHSPDCCEFGRRCATTVACLCADKRECIYAENFGVSFSQVHLCFH